MSLHDRIKEARIKKGLTQEHLGELVVVAKTTITGYEKNREPTAAKVGEIADALNVDVNFLYQDEVRERKENNVSLDELSMVKKYRLISTHSPDGAVVVDTVLDREYAIAEKLREQKEQLEKARKMDMEVAEEIVPTRLWVYYGKIAAAGTSVEFSDMIAGTKEYPINEMNQNADYVIGVNGDSMEPEFFDGDIVFVEKATHINIGDIGIFQKDNNIYIKKAGEDGLVSLKEGYPIITSEDGIRVWGKVLGKAE